MKGASVFECLLETKLTKRKLTHNIILIFLEDTGVSLYIAFKHPLDYSFPTGILLQYNSDWIISIYVLEYVACTSSHSV